MWEVELVVAHAVPVEGRRNSRKEAPLHPGYVARLTVLHQLKHIHLASGWLKTLGSMMFLAERPS
jgi:hypothetical protein